MYAACICICICICVQYPGLREYLFFYQFKLAAIVHRKLGFVLGRWKISTNMIQYSSEHTQGPVLYFCKKPPLFTVAKNYIR